MPCSRGHYGLIEVHSHNNLLFVQGRYIPTEVRCCYGKSSFPTSGQLVHGMVGEVGHRHSTCWMQTKALEMVCGRCTGIDRGVKWGIWRTISTPLTLQATSSSPMKRRRTNRSYFWTLSWSAGKMDRWNFWCTERRHTLTNTSTSVPIIL